MDPTFFASAQEMRDWLEKNHASASELLVGYYKVGTGRPSLTWAQSVDEALCFGWIDGLRKGLDEERYTIRFTPRKPASIWSVVNINRVEVLTAEGRMTERGLAAFAARKQNKSGIYSYEQRPAELTEPYKSMMQANAAAWAFFESQPASYKKAAIWWVISAKQEETRQKRLVKLAEFSASGQRLPQFVSPKLKPA
ncbi:MAG TPA: YdeI/OmpD-associated family protein [Thermoflexales bacterium]|nr:YdeI/OmpD-associated family protein [Thermoflexales bacterium]HRA01241.1 YdeI/OmpD-associated family protein [Thermoflexales bacterium]